MTSKKDNIQERLTRDQLSKIFRYGSLNAVLEGKNYTMQLIIDKSISPLEAGQIFNLLQKYAEGFKNITDLEIENKIRNLHAERYSHELAMRNSKEIQKSESSEKYLSRDLYTKYQKGKKKKNSDTDKADVKRERPPKKS